MTTIACNRKEMACDSRQSGDEHYFNISGKVLRLTDELVGCTGDVDVIARFLGWYRRGDDDPPRLSDTFGGLVLNKNGIYYYAGCGYPTLIDERFFAVGSGALAALAALHCGKTPAEAVAIAAKYDKNTGGPVRTYKLRSAK